MSAGEAGFTLFLEIAKRSITPVVDAAVTHVGYLYNYKSNINNLKQSADDLIATKQDAEDNWDSIGDIYNEEATHTSTAWLNKVKAAEKAANDIKVATEKPKSGCLSKWCPNPIRRYKLSKNAVQKAEVIQQLRIEGKEYVPKTKLAPPPSKLTGALANYGSKDFKTRAKIMDEVIAALEDEKISIIGVCGSGGVGKTTLMHELRERAKVNDLFHEVAFVTVSQNPDLSDIRCKLAEMLGLMSVKDGKNEIATADELCKRLARKGRKTLVILDDIWSDINLEELGIPVGIDQTECKVVVTSRQEGVCNQMKAQKTIPVAVMPFDESWYLFRTTAGDCVESDDLKDIAKEVAHECGGLPVALVTLAKTLSNKKIEIWRDALNQLRKHSVTRIPEMDRKVYSTIKMSYDFLARELPEAEALLLLCCQYPEDAAIEVERLAIYCLMLQLFKNVDSLEDARNSAYSLIEHLKSCFLLEEIDVHDTEKNHGYRMVKMHDIVRDVGLSIVSIVKEERDGVSMQMGTGEDCPNSRFLSRMEELRVVDYSAAWELVGLPAVEVLTNLRMLSLESVELTEDTGSKIGKLTKLEILSFLNGTNHIGPFLRQIGQLRNLKLLDLRFVREESQPIPCGILPEMNKLEELYLGKYYFCGTPEDGEGIEGESNARIAELEMLSSLTTLQIQLPNPVGLLDLKKFCFEKLQRFSIRMDEVNTRAFRYRWNPVGRTLEFEHVSMGLILREKFRSILRRTEELELRNIDDWTGDSLTIKLLASVRELKLDTFEHLEYLIYDGATHEGEGNSSVGAFPNLETLTLLSMNAMKELCPNGKLPARSFGKLRELHFESLPKLTHLCVDPTDPLCLVNLRVVKFIKCGALECIFPYAVAKCLVQLHTLELNDCSRVKEIVSKGEGGTAKERGREITEESTDSILHFPKLKFLNLFEVKDLQGFFNKDDDSRVQPLLTPLVMLPRMEGLDVFGSSQLKQIVGGGSIDVSKLTTSDWLQNLGQLDVGACPSLESVFDFDGQQFMAENANVVTLGALEEITLSHLPNLTRIFCCRMQDMSFPSLKEITVYDCRKLGYLAASNSIKQLQNLRKVTIEDCESIEAVFDFEGLEVMTEDPHAMLSELIVIKLTCLPRLEHVCRLASKEIRVFQNLLFLEVNDCASLGYLFTTSIAEMLLNLGGLSISSCNSLKECIRMDEVCSEKKVVFRSLTFITLENLSNLLSFCSSDQLEFEFPSLGEVSINSCPKMTTFCYGRLTERVMFSSDGQPVWKSDLNQTILHFNRSYPEENSIGDKDIDYADQYDDDSKDFDDSAAVAVDHETEDVLVVDNDDDKTVAGNIDGSNATYQVDDEYVDYQVGGNKVLDPCGTSTSTQLEQVTPTELKKASLECLTVSVFPPNAYAQTIAHSTSSPSVLNDTQDLSYSSTRAEKVLSDSLSDPDDHNKRSRIVIHGVYVKDEMKTAFEEILTENPNFLSAIRVKTAMVKTALVETAIHSLQIIGQGSISSDQLVYVRDSLDDMEANGLDVAWLERSYQKASIVMDEEKAVSMTAELARLEREKTEDEAAFQMAKEKLEASTALRDALKAEFDALMQRLEARKELVGAGLDSERSVGDGLLE